MQWEEFRSIKAIASFRAYDRIWTLTLSNKNYMLDQQILTSSYIDEIYNI